MTLTTKELSAIEDQLGAEKELVAKYRSYAAACTDAQLKAKFDGMAARHQSHFDTLYSLLG